MNINVILRACVRFGVIISVLGIIITFLNLANVLFGFILLGFITIHLGISMWTANKPSSYNAYRECFIDIMGDITSYTLLLLLIFCWLMLPFFVTLPITTMQYWFTAVFLIFMCIITLFEMVVTIRSCLIALERQNPISLAPPVA